MPRPETDGPNTNPDGSTWTVKTTFWPNGSRRTVTREEEHPDGTPKKYEKVEYKKGTGPGADGDKKKHIVIDQDENGNVTYKGNTTFKNGNKSVEGDEVFEYRNGRPYKKTETIIQYCPDGEREKTRIIKVFYWAGQVWRINKDESSKTKWDCETGREIALGLPPSVVDTALLAIFVASLVMVVVGVVQSNDVVSLLGVVIAAISFLVFRSLEEQKKEGLLEELEVERARWVE